MTIEVAADSPLAHALNEAIQPKLAEVGWSTGGSDDAALSEYIVLMLVNGKSPDQISSELSGDLLGLDPNDPDVQNFTSWLFAVLEQLAGQQAGDRATESTWNGFQNQVGVADVDTDVPANHAPELNAPTGPKSMRNGNVARGGREKRMLGHMSKAMDRTGDAVLHRVRSQTGNERVGRNPPTGPRGGRQARMMNMNPMNPNTRISNMQSGLLPFPPMPSPGMNGMGEWPMPPPDIYGMLEQQNKMIQQLSHQLVAGGGGAGPGPGPDRQGQNGQGQNGHGQNGHGQNGHGRRGRGGRPLFDRADPNRPNFHKSAKSQASGSNDGDVEMGQGQPKREAPDPEETVCKYNQRCTNKDCPYAHASPAAPFGVNVDVHDTCSFGPGCRNRKCVARHPSPAAKLAHQSEQDCKFYPNCQNRNCPYRHPTMPPCRNGGDCSTAGCQFTHVKVKCKFNPCLNMSCLFMHEEGQRGAYKDKVWTADSNRTYERHFASDGEQEMIIPGAGVNMKDEDFLKAVV